MEQEIRRKRAQGNKLTEVRRHPFYHLHRHLSWPISDRLSKLNVKPGQITFAMVAVWVAGVILVATGFALIAPLVFYISFILDKVDGELARLNGQNSLVGTYFDEIFHFFSTPSILIAASYTQGSKWFLLLAAIGSFSHCLLKYERKVAHKYQTMPSKRISTIPEWLIQDDLIILVFALSAATEVIFFAVYCAVAYSISCLWRVAITTYAGESNASH